MLRKMACAVVILGMAVGIAMAEEIKGSITKIAEGKVTVLVKSKEDKKGTAKDFELAANVKVSKMEGKNKVEVAGGVKADVFAKLDGKKGVAATLVVDGGKVTEIILAGAPKKKDAK